MPSRTLENKVEDLSKLAATLTEQVGNLQKEIKGSVTAQAETAKVLAAFRTDIALLGQQSAELKNLKEQLGALADLKISIALLERAVEELKRAKDNGAAGSGRWPVPLLVL